MFFSPSFLAAAKLFALTFVVTSIPAAVHAQGAVEGYEYVGVGFCRDALNRYYGAYRKSWVYDNATCGSVCLGAGLDGLRGFEVSSGACFCRVDDGKIVTTSLPTGFDYAFTLSAIGEVYSAGGSTTVRCYKIPGPTNAPSLSSQPSKQPSSAPSSEPTIQPSNEPTSSMKPSSKPSESFQPSLSPSTSSQPSNKPSNEPTNSSKPSPQPSLTPSTSTKPSSLPSNSLQPSLSPSNSMQPSNKPSTSFRPSLTPSNSMKPSSLPSNSLKPSTTPSNSMQPSDKPSTSFRPSVSPSTSFKPSDQPSITPSNSMKPSARPSISPSTSMGPSSEPSFIPTSSLKPSNKPSASFQPSVPPSNSFQPSHSPSNSLEPSFKPSAQPTISLKPSNQPSSPPSGSINPTAAPSNFPSASPTKSQPNVEGRFSGFIFNLASSSLPESSDSGFYSAFAESVEAEILESLSSQLTQPGQRITGVQVTRIGDNSVSRRLGDRSHFHRQLADAGIEVEFDVIFQQICQLANCEDASAIAESALDLLTTSVDASVASDDFLANVKNRLAAGSYNIDPTILDGLTSTQAAEYIVSTIVNTVLPPMWYPDWTGANEGCINDGNEDSYMRLNPVGYYLFDTLESCCSKHYSWNYSQCARIEGSAIGPNGEALYYPDWEGENRSCKNDGRQPAYMSNYPEAWMFADLASCCEKRYHWNLDECMGSSTDAASAGSRNWYPDWERSICVQDCVGASPCGGLAHDWDPQYPSAAACCDSKLNWVSDCNTKSTAASV